MIRGSLAGETGERGDFDGLGVLEGIRNSATQAEMRAWSSDVMEHVGRAVRAKTRPPRAWHAWVRRTRVGARRFARIEGKSEVNAGKKVAG